MMCTTTAQPVPLYKDTPVMLGTEKKKVTTVTLFKINDLSKSLLEIATNSLTSSFHCVRGMRLEELIAMVG